MKLIDFAVSPIGTPVLSAFQIEDYAHELVRDFSPVCLKTVRRFDIQDFVRKELGCRISAVPLCSDGSIQAQTYFRDTFITLYDESGPRRLRVPANTMLINRELLKFPSQARFALAHEAGHYLLHRDFYRHFKGELGSEDEYVLESQADRFAYCILMNNRVMESHWGSMQTYMDQLYADNERLGNQYAASYFAGHMDVTRGVAEERMKQLGLAFHGKIK